MNTKMIVHIDGKNKRQTVRLIQSIETAMRYRLMRKGVTVASAVWRSVRQDPSVWELWATDSTFIPIRSPHSVIRNQFFKENQ